jgi:hypothetical protein
MEGIPGWREGGSAMTEPFRKIPREIYERIRALKPGDAFGSEFHPFFTV